MNLKAVLVSAVLVAGCSATPAAPDNDAVRDFIEVAGFERTDQMRAIGRFNYSYVNDYFVSVSTGSRHYLIEFRSRCMNLRRNALSVSMVDQRRDPTYLRASWDTIRGCPIEKIYSISEADLNEAKALHGT